MKVMADSEEERVFIGRKTLTEQTTNEPK